MSILDLQLDQQPPEIQKLQARMQQIENELKDRTPGLAEALVDIHKNLQLHEELTNLLDDTDIARLHKAHEIHKQYKLIVKEEKVAKKAAKSKKLTNDDLAGL